MPTVFARKLKALRLEQKLTQAAMGQMLHTDASRICRLERGEHPSPRIIEQMNKVFGVNAYEWLVEEEESIADDAKPRVVHINRSNMNDPNDEFSYRAKAIEMLGRMMDMLESLIRNSRGGGG
jgi:transcriptional regulator with XRE-family HTH domain